MGDSPKPPSRPKRERSDRKAANLSSILEYLPMIVMQTDLQGQIVYVNHLGHTYMGYQPGDQLNISSDEPHPRWRKPETNDSYRWSELPISRVIATGEGAEAVLIGPPQPGQSTLMLFSRAQPLLDSEGHLSGVISISFDMTAQRQVEVEAIRRAQVLDTVIEGITDGVIIFDKRGNPVLFNPAALHLGGWDQSQINLTTLTNAQRLALYDFRLPSGEEIPLDQMTLIRALRGEITEPIELTFRRPDNTRGIVSLHASPLRDPLTGEITGAVGVARDITEARHVDHIRDEFMSAASHELRTPLTSMMLASRLLQRWSGRPERQADLLKLADDIANQVRQMSRLTNDMLDLTRITSGRFRIVPQPCDLTQIIQSAVDDQRKASQRTIHLVGIDHPINANVQGERIYQVVANLLANALKYSQTERPVEVEVMVRYTDDNEGTLRVAVRDYGRGISSDELPTLFNRTYYVDAARSDVRHEMVDGLGLGLFIARAIVVGHGGQIWAESTVGEGSTFFFEIPLNAQVSDQEGQ